MSKIITRLHEHDGALTVQRTQDCTPIAEYCKAQHNAGFHGSSELKVAAETPLVIIEKYCNEQGITFHEYMSSPVHIKRVVEHPDNAAFRVWKGKL